MERIWNKIIVLMLCIFTSMQYEISIYLILPLLVCLIFSLLYDLLPYYGRYVLSFLYFILILFFPPYVCYLPLMLYDRYTKKDWYVFLPYLCVYLSYLQTENTLWFFMIAMQCVIALILKSQLLAHIELLATYRLQRDASKEVTLLLEEKNQNLMIQQNYEIQVATLDERNRIAREIHDNVGHLLSSSLLQVGALQTIYREEPLADSLSTLRTTLSTAMDAIRTSVHDLHEDAIQLDMELQKLIKDFTFCKAALTYEIDTAIPKELKYHILAIVKEALHNISKHSNATKATILLREQLSFYQLVIEDNGTKHCEQKGGIGLQNIKQRIALYHGYINIQNETGFRIFITIPKEANI